MVWVAQCWGFRLRLPAAECSQTDGGMVRLDNSGELLQCPFFSVAFGNKGRRQDYDCFFAFSKRESMVMRRALLSTLQSFSFEKAAVPWLTMIRRAYT